MAPFFSEDLREVAKAENKYELCPHMWKRMANLGAKTIYNLFVTFLISCPNIAIVLQYEEIS